jgi:hypothetical protein
LVEVLLEHQKDIPNRGHVAQILLCITSTAL